MADEERIFQLLAQMASRQSEIQRDIDSIGTRLQLMEIYSSKMTTGYESMRADVTRIQLDVERVRDTQYNVIEHIDILRETAGTMKTD